MKNKERKGNMNKIVEILFGSRLYGTDTLDSDTDYKGIYLPTAHEIVLGRYKKTISTTRPKQPFERNTKDDVDLEYFSLDQYLNLLAQGQTLALDMLFSVQCPEMITRFGLQSEIFNNIFENRFELLNRKVNSFVGYAKMQAQKYGQKGFRIHAYRATLDWLKSFPNEQERIEDVGLEGVQMWIASIGNENIKIINKDTPEGNVIPHIDVCGKLIPFTTTFKHTKSWLQKYFDAYGKRALLAEQNLGCDYKALSHSVRVNSEAYELLTTGFITFPRPDRELLLKIKTGQMHYKDISLLIEEGLAKLFETEKISSLRAEPNKEWADQFILEVYTDIVKRG